MTRLGTEPSFPATLAEPLRIRPMVILILPSLQGIRQVDD